MKLVLELQREEKNEKQSLYKSNPKTNYFVQVTRTRDSDSDNSFYLVVG